MYVTVLSGKNNGSYHTNILQLERKFTAIEIKHSGCSYNFVTKLPLKSAIKAANRQG